MLLSRNVKIVGEDNDDWGGQVVVSDVKLRGKGYQSGEIHLDSVEIYNCSQINTHKAAIRFDYATRGSSSIKNSVVHGSRGIAFHSYYGERIEVEDTAFIGARSIGVLINHSRYVIMNRVMTGHVLRRDEMPTEQHKWDMEGCFAICSMYHTDHDCKEVKVTNSVAAGCWYAGFLAPGHKCKKSES